MRSELKQFEEKMDKAIAFYTNDINTIRAGRANPAVLDKVQVEYYGVPSPLNQVGTVSVPEPTMIVIQPWDATALKEIEKAILASDLGIAPQNDGKVIRLSFPPLTEERRKELNKLVKKYTEEVKVQIRNARRDGIEDVKAQKKNGEITEDDVKAAEKDIQKLTDKYIALVDTIAADKEKEIMEI